MQNSTKIKPISTQNNKYVSINVIVCVTNFGTYVLMAKKMPKYKPKQWLTQLREERGLSMEELARRIGRSKTAISNLENGHTGMSEWMVDALSKALNVPKSALLEAGSSRLLEGEAEGPRSQRQTPGRSSPAGAEAAINLVEMEKPPGFHEEAVLYEPAPGERLPALGEHEFYYEVNSNALEHIGILTGDIVIVDIGAERMKRLVNGDAVIAQLYSVEFPNGAKTILRQYLAPSLLVSNALGEPHPVIDMRLQDAQIKGVVVSVHRSALPGSW